MATVMGTSGDRAGGEAKRSGEKNPRERERSLGRGLGARRGRGNKTVKEG